MFTKINELIWTDTKFKKLTDDSKFLLFYVLTCPHKNMLGLYFLPKPYAMFDLGWLEERFSKGLKELSENGFINYNNDTNIMFIKNYLKYNPLENPNQVKGAINCLYSIPSNGVDSELYNYLETLDKPFVKPLMELLHKRFGKQEEEEEEVTEEELSDPILIILKSIKGFPFDTKVDSKNLIQLQNKYPTLYIEKTISDWAIAKLDKPLSKNDNPRSQINTWCKNAVKWGNNIKQISRTFDITKYQVKGE